MGLSRWIRRKVFGGHDPAVIARIHKAAEEASSEARALKDRVGEPDALESLVHRARNTLQQRALKEDLRR